MPEAVIDALEYLKGEENVKCQVIVVPFGNCKKMEIEVRRILIDELVGIKM